MTRQARLRTDTRNTAIKGSVREGSLEFIKLKEELTEKQRRIGRTPPDNNSLFIASVYKLLYFVKQSNLQGNQSNYTRSI